MACRLHKEEGEDAERGEEVQAAAGGQFFTRKGPACLCRGLMAYSGAANK